MNPISKKSKERVDILEKNIWAGIQAGIKETGNKATTPEVIDVLIRYAYQYNKRNLDFTNKEIDKEGKQLNGKGGLKKT